MKRDKRLQLFAKELRKEQNPSEKMVWGLLRNRRFAKFKFRRQYPIGPFIADFVCMDAMLVLELDGETHVGREDYDSRRKKYLEEQGFRVVRVWNNQLHENSEGVMQHILNLCKEGPPHPWLREQA